MSEQKISINDLKVEVINVNTEGMRIFKRVYQNACDVIDLYGTHNRLHYALEDIDVIGVCTTSDGKLVGVVLYHDDVQRNKIVGIVYDYSSNDKYNINDQAMLNKVNSVVIKDKTIGYSDIVNDNTIRTEKTIGNA